MAPPRHCNGTTLKHSWLQCTLLHARIHLLAYTHTHTHTYREYYLSAHSGRRLTWQLNMGTADLKAQFGSRKHELTVSSYQAVILLLFNNTDRCVSVGGGKGVCVLLRVL